jgi:hypothetical protein
VRTYNVYRHMPGTVSLWLLGSVTGAENAEEAMRAAVVLYVDFAMIHRRLDPAELVVSATTLEPHEGAGWR